MTQGAGGARPRVAIVLFNLGGPDRPEAVGPFLRNLFTDPAILRVNPLLRAVLARVIARARTRPAQENYAKLGGGSPLLELTRQQARALEAALPELEARCFVAMRYWHPMSEAVAREVKAWGPDEVLLLPLYPHFSTTTTGSSLTAWREAAAKVGLMRPTTALCCWAGDDAYLVASAAILRRAWQAARAALPEGVGLRVLFSAHGLPQAIVDAGDPYRWQIQRNATALAELLGVPGLDHVVCYQSRATRQPWLEPATEAEIERAGHDKVAVLVVPISFVSEHSETLVELDIDYRALAEKTGVPGYFRVPTQGTDPGFIAALAGLVGRMRRFGPGLISHAGGRCCPGPHAGCPLRGAR